ncbi:DUF2957 domain-containing protein [Burkholderia stagnalis]|uniref:DUF2957 domain-containing protein n=1 Tax=Burkholderia stagnalis TaxID=1503054 RepID=UPI000754D87A|nr:DUF2957 domain-containing protein [Burkholderia stagnalis]KVC56012.1 hypothetical protein WS59_27895 [Burkholderia stagnalis]KVN12139.1 hypothetical protein WT10_28295 [Burkholderia stagnalis]KWI75394.1 hypothetical protein WT75_06575 [Burkholderia stagnalis]KWK62820.1 hypothetical protein WT82_01085 [Burkholderia stagnalis]KWN24719.1 hypothetical protein WT84_04925 [Burkholderia stagnalis]
MRFKPGLSVLLSCAVVVVPFIAGCGGGDDPVPISVPQCSGSTCGPSGPITQPPVVTKLCPDALDYTTTYTGGSGSGEYVKVRFDTTKQTYQMQFIESSVPTSAGQINTTRAGLTISGAFHHPTNLPTAEQNRCAFILDSGATSDGSYAVKINRFDPPMLFVGNGVVGGGIPGATIAFDGIELAPGVVLGVVPSRAFDFYPFIGFSETETDFTKVAGNYNELGIHLQPTGTSFQSAAPQGWQPDVVNWNQTLNADGSCTITAGSDYSCQTTGTPWTRRTNADNSPDNVFVSQSAGGAYPGAGQTQPLVILTPTQAKGIMIVGKLNGVLVPVVIRVGYAFSPPGNPFGSVADAEIGISVLAPATALPANAMQGGFVGATSASACGVVADNGVKGAPAQGGPAFDASKPHPNLPGSFDGTFFLPGAGNCTDGSAASSIAANYTSTLFQGATAAFINPQTSGVTGQFALDYAQATPGKIKVTALRDFNARNANGDVAIISKGDTGWAVKIGNVYAMVVNDSRTNPFFTVGAFIQ